VAECDSVSVASTEGQINAAVRCSIILPAGDDLSKLSKYLLCMSQMSLPADYELIVVNNKRLELDENRLKVSLPTLKVLNPDRVLSQEQSFDRAAMRASGKYLLLVRGFIEFDKLLLEEAVRDLETSGERVSVSANEHFVLVERFHYASLGGFGDLFCSLGLPTGQVHVVANQDFENKNGTVLLVVCLFENNFGDILIYETIDKKLKDAGFETQIVEVSQSLTQSKLVEKANKSDFLYFAGGGIIERWAPQIVKNFDLLHKHIRAPYGVVGLSTGEFDYTAFNNSLKLFSEKAAFFYTRDEESVETFRKAGACKLPIAGVDIAFANDTLARLKRTGNIVTASFRNVPYIDIGGDLDWDMWSDALRKIGVEYLIWDCSNAQEKLGITISENDILEDISKSYIIVAMRFHIILAASMMGVLTIPIAYCPKVKRLAKQLGIEDYCLEPDDHDKLESTFRRLRSNEKTVRKNLEARGPELRSRANEIIWDSIRIMEKSMHER